MNIEKKPAGIALVAVLAILVVLAIIASTFTVLIGQNLGSSALQKESVKLDMLQQSALAHTEALLTASDASNCGEDLTKTPLISSKTFSPVAKADEKYGRWMYVDDKAGNLIGRYRVLLEDESAKVNLNKAYLTADSKGSAWDTGEVNLAKALGVTPKNAARIIKYRYGRDNLPGGRGDDNKNNAKLIVDLNDNNADGKTDEHDEGINEAIEYSASNPVGDDISFTTFKEAAALILNQEKNLSDSRRNAINNAISQRATIYSVDKAGSPTLPTDDPSDINSMTPQEIKSRMVAASKNGKFESKSSNRNQIAANIMDYRDENHVLTTVGGSTYGVEAICFNEVMANEASSAIWARQGYAYPAVMGIGSGADNTWREVYGSVDGKRTIYSPSLFYTDSKAIDLWWPVVGASRLWNIKDDGRKKYGKISFSGSTIRFTLPDGPGKYGSSSKPIFEGTSWVGGDDKSIKEYYEDTLKVMRTRGKTVGSHMKFPNNFFKNQLVDFYNWGGSLLGTLTVKSSTTQHGFVASGSEATKIMNGIKSSGTTNLSIAFHAWSLGLATELPEVSIYQMLRSRTGNAGEYFQVQITRDVSGPENSYKANTLNVSGNPASREYTLEDNKTWHYNNGEPIRTDRQGYLDVMYTSSPKVNHGSKIVQAVSYLRLVAPEVVEMYNASSTPISLANWRVVCNTGSIAKEIGRIKNTAYYDRKLRKRMIDNNPVVMPRGHFYLVNDTQLFDSRYGNADFKWGTTADEQIPVFQMDKKHWGVAYAISKVDWGSTAGGNRIYIEGSEDFPDELLQGETVKFLYEGQEDDPESWDGALIPANWWNVDDGKYVRIWTQFARYDGTAPKENGQMMVCGLPARGGIVSLTLKNEYDQVCSRTVEYGSVEPEELGYSTEKEDPTHYSWIKRKEPTIGGTENEAQNRAVRSSKSVQAWIKNGPYSSVAELKRIRTAADFSNIGTGDGENTGLKKLAALADVLSCSHLRLESSDENAEVTGWDSTLFPVIAHDMRLVKTEDGNWEIDQWKGHTLRFITGPLKGEKFPIMGNTKNSIKLADADSKNVPYSAPSRMPIRNCKGCKFTIGPGYQTPLYYTRKSGQEGTWLWRKAIAVPGTYDFYIHGLSDSIKTTEFMEDNLNADMDIALWNYQNSAWDDIAKRKQYNKSDSISAGKIHPANISPDGDIKLKLIAHNLSSSGLKNRESDNSSGSAQGFQSGYAWFNYAVITPMPVEGRVNFNTASARLLSSLPGIDDNLAKNIERGVNQDGQSKLKPYKSFTDLLQVKDFTLKAFERCANLISLNSYAYTVKVEAETISDINNDGKYEVDSDRIEATSTKRYVLGIEPLENGTQKVEILEKY